MVFSQKYDEEKEEWSETYYLITDVLSLSGGRVIELFLVRVKWRASIGKLKISLAWRTISSALVEELNDTFPDCACVFTPAHA